MIALVTTTIQVPKVLELYRRCADAAMLKDCQFFVAGDIKTPDLSGKDFVYLKPEDQQANWATSRILPWNSITRRNIAVLEALKSKAEIIVTIDDDNIPLDIDYFAHIQHRFAQPFDGLCASSESEWVDVGQMVTPAASHRGFPPDKISPHSFSSVVDADIGVCAGVVLGDPDISAVTRIATHPTVHGVSEVVRSGFVVDQGAWTVFNTQNTAVRREFAPALLCVPQFGRYDDIFASLVCQRMMREKGYYVHFGQPFVWQQRNPHDLNVDLENELFGMKHVVHLAGFLDSICAFAVDKHPVRQMYEMISHLSWCPSSVGRLAQAWMDDVESVL